MGNWKLQRLKQIKMITMLEAKHKSSYIVSMNKLPIAKRVPVPKGIDEPPDRYPLRT